MYVCMYTHIYICLCYLLSICFIHIHFYKYYKMSKVIMIYIMHIMYLQIIIQIKAYTSKLMYFMYTNVIGHVEIIVYIYIWICTYIHTYLKMHVYRKLFCKIKNKLSRAPAGKYQMWVKVICACV